MTVIVHDPCPDCTDYLIVILFSHNTIISFSIVDMFLRMDFTVKFSIRR